MRAGHGRTGLVAGGAGRGGGWSRAGHRQGPGGQRHQAVLAPVPLAHPHEPPWRVEGGDLPRGAVGQAPPAGLAHLQTQAGGRAWAQGRPRAHGRRTPPDGRCVAGPDAREAGPRALPRALVDEAAPIQGEASRARRTLVLSGQRAAVRPALRGPELLGSPPGVWGRVGAGVPTALRRRGGPTPEGPGCAPTASARRHGHPPVRGASQGATSSTRISKREDRSA
jgi:hypothetical protein